MRSAVSMIELVISIVIMGIVVMSLPLLLSQTARNNAFDWQQEAILATKARMGIILSYEWDERSYDENEDPYSRVLDTTGSANADNVFNAIGVYRKGHVKASDRRRLYNIGYANRDATSKAAWNTANTNGIEFFDGKEDNITIVSDNYDFVFNLRLNSNVDYISDTLNIANQTATFNLDITNTQNPTNIKMVEIETTDSDSDLNIVLRSFAANIGESYIQRRSTW